MYNYVCGGQYPIKCVAVLCEGLFSVGLYSGARHIIQRMGRQAATHFIRHCTSHTHTHTCITKKKKYSTPTQERTVKHTKTDLEPVKCEQTDDKTATDGFTEERRATHSTQLATCCCMTPMGYGIVP